MATTSTTPLPLNCTVCPKKPFFSDSSHLLTHVGSKGHLSHYYKLKLKANHDLDAQEAIEIYDQWYCDHNVEQLMSERMTSKDRKRPRRRESGSSGERPACHLPRTLYLDQLHDLLAPIILIPSSSSDVEEASYL